MNKRRLRGGRQHSILLWSDGDMVYALQGGPAGTDLIDFAASIK